MKIEFSNNKRAWCYCPHHEDKERPNLSITLTDDYYGHYKCWACGKFGILSDKQMEELELSKKKRTKPVNINWRALYEEYEAALKHKYPLFEDSLAQQWGVGKKSLSYFNIGFDGEAYTAPMWSPEGSSIGIQRRFPDGNKCCVDGSQLGLFLSCVMDYEGTLVICEGVSDTVAVDDLTGGDIIGRPSCNYGKELITTWLEILKENVEDNWGEITWEACEVYDSIVIIPDNDEVGKKGAIELAESIEATVTTDVTIFEFKGAKDIREYIQKQGKVKAYSALKKFIY